MDTVLSIWFKLRYWAILAFLVVGYFAAILRQTSFFLQSTIVRVHSAIKDSSSLFDAKLEALPEKSK